MLEVSMPHLGVVLDALPPPVFLETEERISRERFEALCQANPDLRIEMTAQGKVIVMPPVHSRTGEQNAEINFQLKLWTRSDGSGVAFDSSTGFYLPNGANRSPDASWVLESRITSLPLQEQEGFLPLCPDFVLELRSDSDSLPSVMEKMQEYMDNGARLGWLIDPRNEDVYVYRPGKEPEKREFPASVRIEILIG